MRRLIALLMLSCLAACGGAPTPTVAELVVAIGSDANPDLDGRPSPVMVRIYELAGPNGLNQADFMQLYTDDGAALGAEMRGRTERVLSPGQTLPLRLELKPGSRGVAVVACFRDYLKAQWRAYADIPPGGTTTLRAEIGARRIALAAGGQQ